MQDAQTCPSCGARNLGSSAWCSQCYASLAEPPPATSPTAPPAPPNAEPAPRPQASPTTTEEVTPEAQGVGPAQAVGEDSPGATWTCRTCDTINPVSVNHCATCNTSIFDSFGAGRDTAPLLSSQEATKYALVPGLAHMKMGQGMHGFTIAVLIGAVLSMSLLLLLGGQVPMGIVMVVVSLGILAASVHDAIRLSERRNEAILLKPRTLTVIGGTAVMLVIFVIWNQGLAG